MKTKILILIFAFTGATAMHTAQAQTYDPLAVQRINDLTFSKNKPEEQWGWLWWWWAATWNNETPKQIVEWKSNPPYYYYGMDIFMTGAASFTGLTTLKKLNLDGNQLTEIDVTNCTQLQSLSCVDNSNFREIFDFDSEILTGLRELDLTGCIELQSLNCAENSLLNLDLANLDKLTVFDGSRQNTYLILYKNEAGEYTYPVSLNNPVFLSPTISYSEGILKSTNRNNYTYFSIQTNKEGFVLSGEIRLIYSEQPQAYDHLAVWRINDLIANNGLQATPNAPETWDFATWNDETPKKIVALDLSYAQLEGNASFAGLTTLQTLNLDGNQLTKIDLKNCTQLQRLMCAGNSLLNLDLAKLDQLTEFDGSGQNNIIIELFAASLDDKPWVYTFWYFYLNNPVFTNSVISYNSEYYVLQSTDKTVRNTDFSVQTNKEGFELTGNMMLSYTLLLGIDSPESVQLKIYSNPNTGKLRIESGELRVKNIDIYDVTGRKQLSTLHSPLSTEIEIDISHLPAGVYFVKVMTEQGGIAKKIMKR